MLCAWPWLLRKAKYKQTNKYMQNNLFFSAMLLSIGKFDSTKQTFLKHYFSNFALKPYSVGPVNVCIMAAVKFQNRNVFLIASHEFWRILHLYFPALFCVAISINFREHNTTNLQT